MDDPAVAVGLTASRPISSGAVITNQLLLAAKAVQRGQSVTLVADAGGLSVRMAGRALSDGLVNQRVRVQNLSSGKIVEGIARSAAGRRNYFSIALKVNHVTADKGFQRGACDRRFVKVHRIPRR